MSSQMTSQLVTDALLMALWRRGRPQAQLMHHSDQGSQPRFNGSLQQDLCSNPTSKIRIAVQSDADASEVGARFGARGCASLPSQYRLERFGWSAPVESLSWSAVQCSSHSIKFSFLIPAEVGALRKVLSQ